MPALCNLQTSRGSKDLPEERLDQFKNVEFPNSTSRPRSLTTGSTHTDSRGSLREPTLHFLRPTQIVASPSVVFTTRKRWFVEQTTILSRLRELRAKATEKIASFRQFVDE